MAIAVGEEAGEVSIERVEAIYVSCDGNSKPDLGQHLSEHRDVRST